MAEREDVAVLARFFTLALSNPAEGDGDGAATSRAILTAHARPRTRYAPRKIR